MSQDRALSWKRGRGKMGVLQPLIGSWRASEDSPMGPVTCEREFRRVLDGAYVQLDAVWQLPDRRYEELAVYGPDPERGIRFWSFTSDGKRSEGSLVEAPDVHPQAIAFEAQMPAGLARMVYWPHESGGLSWAVESRTKNGWKRFTIHHYVPS